jgi:hypothetical protein
MSAEKGWIGEPQPAAEWHDSHYSRMGDKIAARDREAAAEVERALLAKLFPDEEGSDERP